MAGELQSIAEALAARLHRAVAIDDPRLHLLAHTPHDGPVDETRMDSILRLQAPAGFVEWVAGLGLARATHLMRIPANPELGSLARAVAPIRCQDVLLGYVWLIDDDQLLTDADARVVEDAAQAAGMVLYRDQLLDDLQRGRQRELLRDLLSHESTVRQAAAVSLVNGEHFVADGAVIALVVLLRTAVPGEDPTIAVEAALQRASRRFAPRTCLFLARADHGVLLAADGEGALHHGDLNGLADTVQRDVADHASTARVLVGIGAPSPGLANAVDSYEQARRAIRVAEVVPGYGPSAAWSDLGIYRVLVQLPLDTLPPDMIHPGLILLFEQDNTGQLTHTLETYLDHAGNVTATIDALSLHRTSLYYRLNRIEHLTGLRLNDGGERLAVHLGLKLARLVGRYPPAPEQQN